jgi:hypothetical protein
MPDLVEANLERIAVALKDVSTLCVADTRDYAADGHRYDPDSSVN